MSFSYPDGRIDVIAGNNPSVDGTRLWTVELSMGAVFDYRAGVTVRRIHPAPGGPPQWIPLADGAKEIYRYDRATGSLEDLHVAGDLTTSGERPLVTRDGRPLAVLNLDDGTVTAIPGGANLAPAVALIRAAGRWAVGHAGVPGATWAPGVPLWRVDLETGETAAFPTVDASLQPLLGGTAPIFGGGGTTLLADGRVGVTIYDGLGVGLYLAEPGGSWQAVGRRAREVTWFGWAGGPAFVIAAERDCNCYGPLTLSWPPPPAGTPDLLSGTSLQFIAPDGTDVFPPTTTEQLVAFSDDSNSCALVKTDANEWFVVDIQARTRVSLGRADGFAFVTDAR